MYPSDKQNLSGCRLAVEHLNEILMIDIPESAGYLPSLKHDLPRADIP